MQKFILAFIVTIAVVVCVNCAPHSPETIMKEIEEECKAEFNIKEKLVWPIDSVKGVPDNQKCFVKCMVIKFGFAKETGEMDERMIIDIFESEKVLKDLKVNLPDILKKCKNPVLDASCDSVVKQFVCVQTEMELVTKMKTFG